MTLNLRVNADPKDVSILIFSYLDKTSLARCQLVCKNWQINSSADLLWNSIGKQIFGNAFGARKAKKFLGDYHAHKLHSNDQILDAIERFIDRIPLDQSARFSCIVNGRWARQFRAISIEITTKANLANNLNPIDHKSSITMDYLTDLDIREDYIATNPISHAGATRPLTHFYPYHELAERACHYDIISRFIKPKNYKVIVRFPSLSDDQITTPTTMESHIDTFVRKKLEAIDKQLARRYKHYGSIIVAVLVGCIGLRAYPNKLLK